MSVDLQAREIQPLRDTFTHVAKYASKGRPASRYLEATMGAQPTSNFHYRPTWDPEHELFDASRTAIQLKDWYVLKDPRQFYYGTWTMARARQQDALEANYQFIETRDLVLKTSDEVKAQSAAVLLPLRHVAWGGNMNNCFIAAYGYGTAFTAPASFHAMDQLGAAQFLTRLGLTLLGPQALDAGKQAWMEDPLWQPLRRYVEDTLVLQDPFELFVAQNLALDAQLYPLIYDQFVDGSLVLQGGTAVSMMAAFMPEWHNEAARWVDAVVKVAATESPENKALISDWTLRWAERAQAALQPIAEIAFGAESETALQEARGVLSKRLEKASL